jgi:hypothetical protein
VKQYIYILKLNIKTNNATNIVPRNQYKLKKKMDLFCIYVLQFAAFNTSWMKEQSPCKEYNTSPTL